MRTSYTREIPGDGTYYSPSVSERLSHDAYSRYHVLLDDFSDIAHYVEMGEPLRVAVAPDPQSVSEPDGYQCDRCGRAIKSGAARITRSTCQDCTSVEKHADPAPIETPEQRRLRLDPPTPIEMKAINEERRLRRERAATEQQRVIREQQTQMLKEYIEKVEAKDRAEAEAYEKALRQKADEREAERLRLVELGKPPKSLAPKPVRRLKAAPVRKSAPPAPKPPAPKPNPVPDIFRLRTKEERKAELAERKDRQEKARAEREARRIEKQAAAERQFLADLEASNAQWLLGKRIG